MIERWCATVLTMNEVGTPTTTAMGGRCKCQAAGTCSPRVHAALASVLGASTSMGYRGGLFTSSYPAFDDKEQCIRYVLEYVPFHLQQVEMGLLQAARTISEQWPKDRPVRVLDIGSGPGTVALALERLVASGQLKHRFQIVAVEPSAQFCQMLVKVAARLRGGDVEIVEVRQRELISAWRSNIPRQWDIDWITAANVLSPVSAAWEQAVGMKDAAKMREPTRMELLKPPVLDAWSANDLAMVLWHMLERFTAGGKGHMTLIEGGCAKYIRNPPGYIRQIAACGSLRVVAGSPHSSSAGKMSPCEFYRTRYGHDTPNLIMLTMKAAA